MMWLPDGEGILKIYLFVWTESTNVTQTYGQTLHDGTGIASRGARQKSLFLTNISLHCLLSTARSSSVINGVPPDRGKLMTLDRRRSLCIAPE